MRGFRFFVVALSALAFLSFGLTACCTSGGGGGGGGTRAPRDPDAKKRAELRALEQEEARLAALVDAIDKGEYAVVSLRPADVEAAVNKALPLNISASELSPHVSGTITISRFQKVKVRRGKIEFELVGKGKNIQVSSAANFVMSQKEINDYKAAVQGGMTVKVSGTLKAERGDMFFSGSAQRVTLKKKKNLAGKVKDALNGSFFRGSHKVDLGTFRLGSKNLAARAIITKGEQVNILFAR